MAWELYDPLTETKSSVKRVFMIGCVVILLTLIFGGFLA